MSSSQPRRKKTVADQQARRIVPPRSRDGDRRRRAATDPVREALERKRITREWTIDDAPLTPEVEDGSSID